MQFPRSHSNAQGMQQKLTINNKNEDLFQELISNKIFFPGEFKKGNQLKASTTNKSKLPNISDILNQKKS